MRASQPQHGLKGLDRRLCVGPYIGTFPRRIDFSGVFGFLPIVNDAGTRQRGHGWALYIGDSDLLTGQLANNGLGFSADYLGTFHGQRSDVGWFPLIIGAAGHGLVNLVALSARLCSLQGLVCILMDHCLQLRNASRVCCRRHRIAQVLANHFLIKGFETNTEVVHVSVPRCGTTLPANIAVNRYYIDQGITGTQLNEPEFWRRSPLDNTSQDLAIKRDHGLSVLRAYDYMIQSCNSNHLELYSRTTYVAG